MDLRLDFSGGSQSRNPSCRRRRYHAKSRPRTDYNRELIGQGTAQILAGLLSLLPVSGVIARSSANIFTGARTPLSTILHGVWVILFVVAFPNLLKLIPQLTISAVLSYIALCIIKFRYFRHLWQRHPYEALTFPVTFGLTVALTYSWALLGAHSKFSVFTLSHLLAGSARTIWRKSDDSALSGRSGYFLQLPMLTTLFSRISRRSKLEVDTKKLVYVGHACNTSLESLRQEFEGSGGSLKIISAPSP